MHTGQDMAGKTSYHRPTLHIGPTAETSSTSGPSVACTGADNPDVEDVAREGRVNSNFKLSLVC